VWKSGVRGVTPVLALLCSPGRWKIAAGVGLEPWMLTLRKISVYLLIGAFLFSSGATSASRPGENKQEKSKDERELIARCKCKLIKDGRPAESKNQKWGKDEKCRDAPVISYTIKEDGSVTKLKLKRGSGVRWIDEYALEWVKGRKYQAMPGCPGVDSAETIIIDFQ
jgi:TonB-like protein